MKLIWRILKGTLSDALAESFLLIVYNFVWLILSILILPLPFATGGLFYAVRAIGERQAVGWRTFFDGARQLAGPMYRWGALNLGVGVALVTNISFYGRIGQVYSDALQSLFITLGLLWLLLQLFLVPTLIRLKRPSLRLALQDSFFLMMRYPGSALVVTLVIVVVVSLSVILIVPLALATFALVAVLVNRTVTEELALQQAELGRAERHAKKRR